MASCVCETEDWNGLLQGAGKVQLRVPLRGLPRRIVALEDLFENHHLYLHSNIYPAVPFVTVGRSCTPWEPATPQQHLSSLMERVITVSARRVRPEHETAVCEALSQPRRHHWSAYFDTAPVHQQALRLVPLIYFRRDSVSLFIRSMYRIRYTE
jgi:hypothetical protein